MSWQEHAACADKPARWFFGPDDVIDPRAAELCAACTVRVECYQAGRGEHGTWGGVDERTRLGRSPRGLPFGVVSCWECGAEFQRDPGGPIRCAECRKHRAAVQAAERQRKRRAS